MGRYFGREPRYSRDEIERQAQEAIDARIGLGRPPDEEWHPLEQRLAEIDSAVATRPPVEPLPEPEPEPEPQPLRIREIRMPAASKSTAATSTPARSTSSKSATKAPVAKPRRQPVAARPNAN